MNSIKMIAGEPLEPGNLVHMIQNRAYKICSNTQIPDGVISKYCETGDVIDDCISRSNIPGNVNYTDEFIGTAGEDLIEGGVIEFRADGKWYNKKDLKTKRANTK